MTCEARCRTKIAELHAFFQAWFRGDVPNADDAFARFESVMAPGFQIITPGGEALDRDRILAAVRAAHDSDLAAEIWTRNHRHRLTVGELTVMTYEEWQSRAGSSTGRLSTAVLRAKPEAPNGFEWLHVYETWLPDATG